MSDPVVFGDAAFSNFLDNGQLRGSLCTRCGTATLPPRPFCPNCHGADMNWTSMSGHGRLIAYTSIAIGPPWMADRGYNRNNPYCLAVVELDEGPRVVARINGLDAAQQKNIPIGTELIADLSVSESNPVQLVFTPV